MTTHRLKGEFFTDALHIFILCGFAVAQPLFDLLSRNAEFFIARHSKPVDVLLLILVLCVLLPLLLVLTELLIGFLGKRIRKGAHWVIVAILLMSIALQALDKIFELPGVVLLVGAAVAGIGATVAYAYFRPVRIFLTVLCPSVLIFPSLFLFNSPVFKVVFPEKDPFAVAVKIDNPPPIIMIVFDEFPVTSLMDEHRQIDPIRYPNFAALAEDAYWFRNATTVGENTHVAIPAILTGKYPDGLHLPTATEYPHNLFTLLGGVYKLHVSEFVTRLCPERLGGGGVRDCPERMLSLLIDLSCVYLHITLPPFMRSNLPDVTRNWNNFGQFLTAQSSTKKEREIQHVIKQELQEVRKDRRREFEQFIDSICHTEQPALYYCHILLPHAPYIYLPSGKKYGLDSGLAALNNEKWCPDIIKVNQSYQRYLLQVGFMDTLIGKLIGHLKRKGLYDQSIIIITADHGVSFLANDFRRPLTKTNHGDIMPVPLFIKAGKQQEGVISDRNVESIDILPTIADILGVDLPWETDGSSAFDLSIPERTEKIIYRNNGKERLVFDSDLVAKYVGLKRKLEVFGSGTRPYGLFKPGLHNELVGKHISEVRVLENARIVVELDQPGLYDRVDLESRFLPAQISGSIREGTANEGGSELATAANGTITKGTVNEGALDLAVAVKGIIWGVTRSSNLKHGIRRFSVVVPETSFRDGKNDIIVFVVSRSGGKLCLERIRDCVTEKYSYKPSADGQGEIIISSKSISIPLKENALKGYLDIADIRNDRGVFVGWAADIKNCEVPAAIVIFLDGEFFYSGHCNAERSGVAKHFKAPALEASGFNFVFPLELFKDIDNSEIRFFAVSKRGFASELHYPKGYKWGKKS